MLDIIREYASPQLQSASRILFVLFSWQKLSGTENNINDIRIDAQEMDYFTPPNSLLGSISALQLLYEGGSGEIENILNLSINDVSEIERSAEDVFGDFMDQSVTSKKEDSEYCIIRNEKETNDGWMVLSDD